MITCFYVLGMGRSCKLLTINKGNERNESNIDSEKLILFELLQASSKQLWTQPEI